MKLTLNVEEACSFLQMNERTLKSGLITKVINNKPRYKYHIPIKKAEKYMGISYEDFLKMR